MAPQDIVKAQRDRYLYVLSLLVGQKAEAELLEKKTMTGVLHTATPFSDMPHRMKAEAARIAAEIENATTSNIHLAEERGQRSRPTWTRRTASGVAARCPGLTGAPAKAPAPKAPAPAPVAAPAPAPRPRRGEPEPGAPHPAPAPSTLKLNPEAKAFQFNVGAAEWTPSFAAAPPPPPPAPYGPGLPYGFTPPPQFMAPPAARIRGARRYPAPYGGPCPAARPRRPRRRRRRRSRAEGSPAAAAAAAAAAATEAPRQRRQRARGA
ncbi:hypothetical protein JL721_4023 [Aureococcus anophagefferens]|nr:hypothetical protein JL721_4023 [Aureococcus anophagefferens]